MLDAFVEWLTTKADVIWLHQTLQIGGQCYQPTARPHAPNNNSSKPSSTFFPALFSARLHQVHLVGKLLLLFHLPRFQTKKKHSAIGEGDAVALFDFQTPQRQQGRKIESIAIDESIQIFELIGIPLPPIISGHSLAYQAECKPAGSTLTSSAAPNSTLLCSSSPRRAPYIANPR